MRRIALILSIIIALTISAFAAQMGNIKITKKMFDENECVYFRDRYGELYINSVSKEITISVAGEYSTITDMTENTCSTDMAVDEVLGTITPRNRGRCQVYFGVNIEADKGCEVTGALFRNNIKLNNVEWSIDLKNANDINSAGASGLVNIEAGDVFDIRLSSSQNDTTVSLRHVNFLVERI